MSTENWTKIEQEVDIEEFKSNSAVKCTLTCGV